jgi:CBS domain-containing protein
MLKLTKISEIMTNNVFTVDIQDTLRTADEIMRREKLRHIPVLENNRYVGMLNQQKIYEYTLRHLYDYEEKPDETSDTSLLEFENILDKNLHFLYPEDSIQKAVELFTKYRYDCLPVVDWDKNLVGILSTIDVLLFIHRTVVESK